MTKTVLVVLCLIIAVYVILFNNLVSNAYAQERIQCPEINLLSINNIRSYWTTGGAECYYDFEMDWDGDGYLERGFASILLIWPPDKSEVFLLPDETCWEWNQKTSTGYSWTDGQIESTMYYAIVTHSSFWTSISSSTPPFADSVKNVAINLLRELEGSGFALPCEAEEFDFNIDVEPKKISILQGQESSVKSILSFSGTPKPVKLSVIGLSDNKLLSQIELTQSGEANWVFNSTCEYPPSEFFYAIRAEGGGISKTSEAFSVEIKPNPDCPGTVTQPQEDTKELAEKEEPSKPFDFTIVLSDPANNVDSVGKWGRAFYYFGIRTTSGTPEPVAVSLGGPDVFDLVQNNGAEWNINGQAGLTRTPDFNGLLMITTNDKTKVGEYNLDIVAASKKVKKTFPISLTVTEFVGKIYDPSEDEEYYLRAPPITSIIREGTVVGKIGYFDGEVMVKVAGHSNFIQAHEGFDIRNGDIITTGDGNVFLHFNDGKKAILTNNGKYSIGTLTEQIQDPKLNFIEIIAGAIKYQSLPQQEKIVLYTPAATVRTEGTDVIVIYDDFASLSIVDIKEGQVTVMPTFTGKATKYEAGQTIATNINGLTTVMPLDEGRWKALVSNFALGEKETDEQQSMPTSVSEEKDGGCLIATATYGSELAPQVQFLREIRDSTVLSTASGVSFMTAFNAFYYSFSPTIADLERQNPMFKEIVKTAITPLLSSLSLLQYVDIYSEAEMLVYGIGIILLNVGMYFVAPVIVIYSIRKII